MNYKFPEAQQLTIRGVPDALPVQPGPQDPTAPPYPHPALVPIKQRDTSLLALASQHFKGATALFNSS